MKEEITFMTITLCMILDLLRQRHSHFVIDNYCSCPVKGIKLLSPRKSLLNSEFLYLSWEDGRIVISYGEELRVYLNTTLEIEDVFNEIQDIYTLLRDWDISMHLSFIQNKGVQELLDFNFFS